MDPRGPKGSISQGNGHEMIGTSRRSSTCMCLWPVCAVALDVKLFQCASSPEADQGVWTRSADKIWCFGTDPGGCVHVDPVLSGWLDGLPGVVSHSPIHAIAISDRNALYIESILLERLRVPGPPRRRPEEDSSTRLEHLVQGDDLMDSSIAGGVEPVHRVHQLYQVSIGAGTSSVGRTYDSNGQG